MGKLFTMLTCNTCSCLQRYKNLKNRLTLASLPRVTVKYRVAAFKFAHSVKSHSRTSHNENETDKVHNSEQDYLGDRDKYHVFNDSKTLQSTEVHEEYI